MSKNVSTLILILLTLTFHWSCEKELDLKAYDGKFVLGEGANKQEKGRPDNPGSGNGNNDNFTFYDVALVAGSKELAPGDQWTTSENGLYGESDDGTFYVKFNKGIINVEFSGSCTDPNLQLAGGASFTDIQHGEVTRFWIGDGSGKKGKAYTTDHIPFTAVPGLGGDSFEVVIDLCNIPLREHKNHNGGPVVAVVGCINLGKLVFTKQE